MNSQVNKVFDTPYTDACCQGRTLLEKKYVLCLVLQHEITPNKHMTNEIMTIFCLVKHQAKFVSCVYAMESTCRVTQISRL